MSSIPKILVVDDQPVNVKLLQRKLEQNGLLVWPAFSGRQCLDQVKKELPDLILLDIMMPGMDGFEVCNILKKDESTKTIPIIFITAKTTKEGKLKGLEAGAVDYITKPIDLDETFARVQTQVRFQQINRENIELQKRLADSRQTAAIGAITQGISHNLNNLLGVVVGYLDLLTTTQDNSAMVERCCKLMDQAIQRMVNIVRQLGTIANKESFTLQAVPLQRLLDNSIRRFQTENNISNSVVVINPLENIPVPANVEVFESILGKLLINALESYPEGEENRQITVKTELVESESNQRIRIKVLDEGAGISPEVKDHIFEPFISGKTSVGRGMGLTIARHGIRNLGGELILKPRTRGGISAELTHPL